MRIKSIHTLFLEKPMTEDRLKEFVIDVIRECKRIAKNTHYGSTPDTFNDNLEYNFEMAIAQIKNIK